MQSGIAQKSRDDIILKGDAGRRTGGRLWSNCVSWQGGIRDGKRVCVHHSAGMDAADCIVEPVVLAESHCIVP